MEHGQFSSGYDNATNSQAPLVSTSAAAGNAWSTVSSACGEQGSTVSSGTTAGRRDTVKL